MKNLTEKCIIKFFACYFAEPPGTGEFVVLFSKNTGKINPITGSQYL